MQLLISVPGDRGFMESDKGRTGNEVSFLHGLEEKKSGYQCTFSWTIYLLKVIILLLFHLKIVMYLNSIFVVWEPGEVLESENRFDGSDGMSEIR